MPGCMAGAIQTLLFVLSMSSIFVLVFYVVLVSSYRLCCLLFPSWSVSEFFDGWQILIVFLFLYMNCLWYYSMPREYLPLISGWWFRLFLSKCLQVSDCVKIMWYHAKLSLFPCTIHVYCFQQHCARFRGFTWEMAIASSKGMFL